MGAQLCRVRQYANPDPDANAYSNIHTYPHADPYSNHYTHARSMWACCWCCVLRGVRHVSAWVCVYSPRRWAARLCVCVPNAYAYGNSDKYRTNHYTNSDGHPYTNAYRYTGDRVVLRRWPQCWAHL